MNFDPTLPQPYSEDWREAYLYDKEDRPRLTAYQSPNGAPVPFVLDNIRFSGGQSVDTAEYTFFGLWSNTSLNEKPHTITINGFIRGDTYIKNRNALVEALRVKTDDNETGFIDLPLWGRFPVVVVTYDVDEKGNENGQCAVSLTFTRAGVTTDERWKFEGDYDVLGRTEIASKNLFYKVIAFFQKSLLGKLSIDSLTSGFTSIKATLIGIIGCVQGSVSLLNKMTNSVTGITNLIAQGVNSPRELAEALFGAYTSIVTGAMEVKNTYDDTVFYFNNSKNYKKMVLQFLSADNYDSELETVTVNQYATKESVENLYRAAALCAAAQILVQMDMTYQEAQAYWTLYKKLEDSVDQNDPEVYQAIRDMRLSVSRELVARKINTELKRNISQPVPLLYLSHELGCNDEELRLLNNITDSFVIQGDVIYV